MRLRVTARSAALKYLELGYDPLEVLIQIAANEREPSALRVQAATAAAQYVHPRLSAQAITSATVTAPVNSGAALERLMQRLAAMERPAPAIEPPTAEPDGQGDGSAP